jgi:uncharacterized BrkB/YihY/UPF0761 family membrane protein
MEISNGLRKKDLERAINNGSLDKTARSTYFIGTVSGIIIGVILIISGLLLLVLGLSGSIDWIFETHSIKSRLTNASPGVFFALLGVFVLYWYRPRIEIRKEIGHEKSEHIFKLKTK